MDQRQKALAVSVIWFGIAIAICVGSVRLSLGQLRVPGPGFFSFICGGVMAVLAVVVFIQTWKSREGSKVKKPFWANPPRGLKMTYVYFALILYAFAMEYIGFTVSTLLFLGFLLRGIDPQSWRVTFGWSILATACADFVFKYWLDVQLPGGPLGW